MDNVSLALSLGALQFFEGLLDLHNPLVNHDVEYLLDLPQVYVFLILRTIYSQKYILPDCISSHSMLLHPSSSDIRTNSEDELSKFFDSAFPQFHQKDQNDESYAVCLLDAQEQIQNIFELLPEESFKLTYALLKEESVSTLSSSAALETPHSLADEEPEGLFLNILFDKLAGALEQPLSVNLAVTSLLSRLAMCPDRQLHCFLLDTRIMSCSHGDTRFLWSELAKVYHNLIFCCRYMYIILLIFIY